MKLPVCFVVFWLQLLGLKTSDAALNPANNSESKLLQYIFTNYSADIRPVLNQNDPVVIRFGFMLKQIIDLDIMTQILTTNVWLRMYWKNELISWDPEQFNGLKVINIKPSQLWVPDITIFNSATKTPSVGDLYNKITSQVIVRHTGDVNWLSPAIITTECQVDVRYFPFDTQICEVEFGSWTYDGFRVDLQLQYDYVDTKQYSVSKEWHLYKTLAERTVKMYKCCPEPYPSTTFQLVIKRRPMFFLSNMIIPCGLITLLSLVSFILPPNSGERVSFIMTVLLSLSVYMLMVTDKMPQTSETPLASKFFICMMVQIGCSLVATCFIIKFYNSNTPISPLFDKIINHWLASFLLMKRKNERKKATDLSADDKDSQDAFFKNTGFLKDDTDIVITRVHDQGKTEHDINDKNIENNRIATNFTNQDETSKLIKEVKVISDKLRERDEEERMREDWAFATDVLDRFFICSFASSIFLACVVIFAEVVQDN